MTGAGAWHPDWPGFEPGGSLVLPLPDERFRQLEPRLCVDGIELRRKREFHATLLDAALGTRVRDSVPDVAARFAKLDWQWQLTGERWLLREDKGSGAAHTVIELLDMPALNAFRRDLSAPLGDEIPDAPAHVTLYLANSDRGIGLSSLQEFERLRLRRL